MKELPDNKIKLTAYTKNQTDGEFIFYARDYYDVNIAYKQMESFSRGTWPGTKLKIKSYIDTIKGLQFKHD